jgi:hypothetical protein
MGFLVRAAISLCFVATAGALAVACGTAGSVSNAHEGVVCSLYWGGGIIPPHPDGASLCGKGVCNYQTQTGCESGKTCGPHLDLPTDTVAPLCRYPGTQAEGQPCDNTATPPLLCGTGTFCADGLCRKLCCGGDWSACPAGQSCIRQAEYQVGPKGSEKTISAGVDLCFPVGTCDVFDTTACKSEGRVCRIVDPTGAVACAPDSPLALGDSCDHDHQCGAGMVCADAADGKNGVCRRLCRWTFCGEPSCQPGEGVCVHFNRDPVGGRGGQHDTVGECTPNWRHPEVVSDGGVIYASDGGALYTGVIYKTDGGSQLSR